jgi:proteasome activator subunit 2 (PA28 beta)
MTEILKRDVTELNALVSAIKLFVQLNVPRIEDGNNFGVGVQEEVLGELNRAEDTSFNMLESMTKYHMARAKLISKMTKYPQIEDYRQSVLELDDKHSSMVQFTFVELRYVFCFLIHCNAYCICIVL